MAAKNIEVILKQDVEGLGHKYDIVRVRPGYAWNYLIPKGLADLATEGNKKHLEAHLRQIAHRLAQEKAAAQQLAEKLSQVKLHLKMPAGKEGKLFGAVTPQQIVSALAEQGYILDRRQVHFPTPIRALGSHVVEIRLHREIVITLQVEVSPLEE
ncbi:MAG: 50S ribosomal protein L9 [Bacteroidia bacterium]|nr:50S ribosomal protein L9 [Bacteroidia bacterium]MDW8134183.1 50S ribosomal protein L9 [Bacteroidia bacterium]